MAKYKRVLIKLSGEALGDHGRLFDFEQIDRVADVIRQLHETGAEIAIVIGAGNIWRGRQGPAAKMTAVNADHMGMLGTTINSIAMQDAVERQGIESRVMSAVEMTRFCEPYTYRRAVRHLENGRVLIFAYRTGNPFFSTDTAPALRAVGQERRRRILQRPAREPGGEAAARHHLSGSAGARPQGDGCFRDYDLPREQGAVHPRVRSGRSAEHPARHRGRHDGHGRASLKRQQCA